MKCCNILSLKFRHRYEIFSLQIQVKQKSELYCIDLYFKFKEREHRDMIKSLKLQIKLKNLRTTVIR
jgi:hypothetical protein